MIDFLANITEWMTETPPTAPPRRLGRYKKKNECCDDNSRDCKFPADWERLIRSDPSGKRNRNEKIRARGMNATIHLGVVSSASCIWPVCVVCWDCCLIWRSERKIKIKKINEPRTEHAKIGRRCSRSMLWFGSDGKEMKQNGRESAEE